MNKEWWFFTAGFMDWAKEEFTAVYEHRFAYDMLKNIINYILDTTETQSEFLEAITKIVPEVTMEEWMEWINK